MEPWRLALSFREDHDIEDAKAEDVFERLFLVDELTKLY